MLAGNKKTSNEQTPIFESYTHRPSPYKEEKTHQTTTQKRDDSNNKK